MSDEQETGPREQNKVFKGEHQQAPQLPPQMAGLPTKNEGPREYAGIDDLGFEVPVDEVPLPSRGKCYPPGTPLHGVDRVAIRAMTAKEEDILTSKAFLKNGTVITHLLRACITNRSVDPRQLLSGDRQALMVALRITGYGADYTIEVECPACATKQAVEFDLADLPVKWLDMDPINAGENLFAARLPVSKKEIKYRFMTGIDEEELQVETQQKRKKLKTQLDNLVTSRFMRQIVSVDGRTDKGYIAKFINHMPARDSRYLRKIIAEAEPGMEMEAQMMCQDPDCGEISEVDVAIRPEFFWPAD